MKSNNTNTIIKLISILLTLQTCIITPIQMPLDLMQFNQGTGVDYIKNCKKIDEYINKTGLLNYRCTTNNNLPQTISFIENQLATFEKELLAAEHKALIAIKEKYHISNIIWQKYMADMHRMKTIYTKSFIQNNSKTVHDPNIPANMLEIITTLLKQNNINPQSVHLKMISNQEYLDNDAITLAQTFDSYNYILPLKISEDNILIYRYIPSTIEIFPITNEKSITDKIAIYAHEIQHLIQHHSLTVSILITYLTHYYHVDSAEFKKTPEYIQFAQIHEAQAEILAAIKDPKIAECLKKYRQTLYYPDHLYEEHFFHLAYINALWKIHTWLTSVQQDGINATNNKWLEKINQILT